MRLFGAAVIARQGKCDHTETRGYQLIFCVLKKMRRNTVAGLFSLMLFLLHASSVGSQLDIESYRSILGDVFVDEFYLNKMFPDVDHCSNSPCLNNAKCVSSNLAFDYECICQDGYTGLHCENETDACCSQPCQNHGECIPVEHPRGYMCDCMANYTGNVCEAAIKEGPCLEGMCLNNGTCVDIDNGTVHLCACSDRYLGDLCEIDTDPCASQPCLNKGICANVNNTYHCTCTDDFTGYRCGQDARKGETCSIRLDDTRTVTVLNNGRNCSVLQLMANNVTYALPGLFNYFLGGNHAITTRNISFRGIRVVNVDLHLEGLRVDEILETLSSIKYVVRCKDRPCRNDALCIDVRYGYICQCVYGFIGPTCEVPAEIYSYDPCTSHPCLNGGSCNREDHNYRCNCVNGFTGRHCKRRLITCMYAPCANGGICTDHPDGFTCACKDQFTGRRCETLMQWKNATDQDMGHLRDKYVIGLTVVSVMLASALGLSIVANGILLWERHKRKSIQVSSRRRTT